MDRLRQIFRLYRLYGRMDRNFVMQDKLMGIVCIFCEWLYCASAVSGVALLAVRFGGIGGMTADEILWMMGFFTIGDGLSNMLMGGFNVLHISRRVGRGQVDHMLIQPVPLWVQLLTEGFMPYSGSSGFLSGVILTVYATGRLDLAVTPGWLLLTAIYALARVAVTAGVSYLTGAAAFYRPVSCEEISSVAMDVLAEAGKYPLAALPVWAQGIFLTALPVGLMAYVPSLILLQKVDAPLLRAWPVAAGAAFAALAGVMFRKGLKHYAAYGCPRYKEMGHRR